MDRVKICIEQEQVDDGALFIQVRVNDDDLPGILNIEAFFALRESHGLVPLFTCGCGIFGCGGYYVNVSCTDTTLILQNSYHRFNHSLQAEFEYHLYWQEVSNVAQEILTHLQKLQERNSQANVTTGYGGGNLLDRLPDFRKSSLIEM